MSRHLQAPGAALGFRVKSGWACAVVLIGAAQAPQALDRRRLELSDPAIPESLQPYHAAMGKLETDEAKIGQRAQVIERATKQSVAALLDHCRAAGQSLGGAGLVVGSQIDPATIANPHIRAHALEGRLFRSVLQEALQARGLPCTVVVERQAYDRAAAVLGRSAADLKRAVGALGQALSGPWRAEEKLASLAAWMTLA
jgi:hypothetical protein